MGRGELTADFQEPFLLLGVLGDVNFVDIVLYAQLLKGDVHFVAIWCAWTLLVIGMTRRVPSDTSGIAVDSRQHTKQQQNPPQNLQVNIGV